LPFSAPVVMICWSVQGCFEHGSVFQSFGCPKCSMEPDRIVREGDRVQVGAYDFHVIHTPGHAPGHISLYEPKKRLLLAGDLIGRIPAWYAPSSGGVGKYLDSLQKIEKLDIDLILPSHGSVIRDAAQAIRGTREKILERDCRIIRSLETGTKSFAELNALLFGNPSTQFFPGVPILESHLQKLKDEGRITTRGVMLLCVMQI